MAVLQYKTISNRTVAALSVKCCSAGVFDADRRANPLSPRDSGGSNFGA